THRGGGRDRGQGAVRWRVHAGGGPGGGGPCRARRGTIVTSGVTGAASPGASVPAGRGDEDGATAGASGGARRGVPCLAVDAGRVVKGVNFRGLRDAGDPVALARRYDADGADELVFLDITASSGDRETTYDVVRRTASEVFIPLTVGGGVRTVADADR